MDDRDLMKRVTGTDPLRMDAYYYSFEPTGVPEIDRILSAVAWAGKAVHHTEYWTDDAWEMGSPVEWIQAAANEAAKAFVSGRPSPKEKDE